MRVVNALWAPNGNNLAARAPGEVRLVVVHRIEVSQEDPSFADTPQEIARFFSDHPVGRGATGGGMPYPILIDAAGQVFQTVPLGRICPHVRDHNPHSVGVGVIGDFRARPPTREQHASLRWVCEALLGQLGLKPEDVRGHDELVGASSDPNKECPGRMLDLEALRRELAPSDSVAPFVW